MAEKSTKRGGHVLARGRVIPVWPDASDVLEFLNECGAELKAELDTCPDYEMPGQTWPAKLLRKWRDSIDEMLPASLDGRPQKTKKAHVEAFAAWKAKNPERPDADYFRRHMGAKTDAEVRACREALRRARNSK
jgi:hypothetical protein